MQLSTIDLAIVGAYALALIVIATVVSREKAGHAKDSTDYFLAGKSLPWWAVGASLIAANISAEQIIGMSGSGYVVGLAIASYEWMAAATLLIVGKYFLPIFLKRGMMTTIEEFLMSAEYILAEGNHRVILCERGIRTFERATRNTLDISAVPVLKGLTHLLLGPQLALHQQIPVAPDR